MLTRNNFMSQMTPECGGCSRPGCAAARLVESRPAGCARLMHGDLLAAEAELHQQHASQKPYRVGLILLCVGALFNWLGLAQAYVEPMRYIGVGCIVAGALLICAAMCRWLGRGAAAARQEDRLNGRDEVSSNGEAGHGGPVPLVHVISLPRTSDAVKPPDYETLVAAPPSYEDAIKLRPSLSVVDETPQCSATNSATSCPQYEDIAKNETEEINASPNNSPVQQNGSRT